MDFLFQTAENITRTLTLKAVILLQEQGFVCYQSRRFPYNRLSFGDLAKNGLNTEITKSTTIYQQLILDRKIYTDSKQTNKQTRHLLSSGT